MEKYSGVVNTSGQIIVKKQSSVLSKSLLVAGIAFGLMFLFSFLLFWVLDKTIGSNPQSNVIDLLYIVSIVSIIAVMIMSIYVSFRMAKVKLGTIIAMISLYAIANGIMFGILFYAIQHTDGMDSSINMQDFLYCFLITGAVFAICGGVGSILSTRFTLSLGKFLMIATFSLLGFLLIFGLISVFAFHHNFDTLHTVILGVWGLLMIGYIMFDFSVIRKSQSFMDLVDDDMQIKYVFLFGFTLLIDLINMLWIIIRIYASLKR